MSKRYLRIPLLAYEAVRSAWYERRARAYSRKLWADIGAEAARSVAKAEVDPEPGQPTGGAPGASSAA